MRMFCLVLILLVAVVMDLKSYKIKNALILAGMMLGLYFQYTEYGRMGILYAAAGIGLPILCLWILFCIRAMGAGDVKLLSMTGCYIGPVKIAPCMLYTMIIGGVMALCLMIWHGNIRKRFQYLFSYILKAFRTGKCESYYEETDDKKEFAMHFSIAVLISVILHWEGLY